MLNNQSAKQSFLAFSMGVAQVAHSLWSVALALAIAACGPGGAGADTVKTGQDDETPVGSGKPATESINVQNEYKFVDLSYFRALGIYIDSSYSSDPAGDLIEYVNMSSFAKYCSVSEDNIKYYENLGHAHLTPEAMAQDHAKFRQNCGVRLLRGVGSNLDHWVIATTNHGPAGPDLAMRTEQNEGVTVSFISVSKNLSPASIRSIVSANIERESDTPVSPGEGQTPFNKLVIEGRPPVIAAAGFCIVVQIDDQSVPPELLASSARRVQEAAYTTLMLGLRRNNEPERDRLSGKSRVRTAPVCSSETTTSFRLTIQASPGPLQRSGGYVVKLEVGTGATRLALLIARVATNDPPIAGMVLSPDPPSIDQAEYWNAEVDALRLVKRYVSFNDFRTE